MLIMFALEFWESCMFLKELLICGIHVINCVGQSKFICFF